jgi:hypothetical protein
MNNLIALENNKTPKDGFILTRNIFQKIILLRVMKSSISIMDIQEKKM